MVTAELHAIHEAQCGEVLIKCNYGCGATFKRKDMNDHLGATSDARLMHIHFLGASKMASRLLAMHLEMCWERNGTQQEYTKAFQSLCDVYADTNDANSMETQLPPVLFNALTINKEELTSGLADFDHPELPPSLQSAPVEPAMPAIPTVSVATEAPEPTEQQPQPVVASVAHRNVRVQSSPPRGWHPMHDGSEAPSERDCMF